jgi:hypothetical protein
MAPGVIVQKIVFARSAIPVGSSLAADLDIMVTLCEVREYGVAELAA